MSGVWEVLENMEHCGLPQELATGFAEVT